MDYLAEAEILGTEDLDALAAIAEAAAADTALAEAIKEEGAAAPDSPWVCRYHHEGCENPAYADGEACVPCGGMSAEQVAAERRR